jgi:putative cardiolipin synthase
VVDQVGAMFDAFWNSELTYSISVLTPKRLSDAEAAAGLDGARRTGEELQALKFELPGNPVEAERVVERSQAKMVWAPARLIYDRPPRADEVGETSELQPTLREFGQLAKAARHDILIESAYLVLDDQSLALIEDVEGRGVSVRALTNSLSSNDVTANHAAYARRREPIVASGIDVYELRPDAASCATLVVIDGGCSAQRIFGLHAKSFVFDGATLYVGSMNLNLRSAYLNAESALIIESPELAGEVASAITLNMQPANSWHVTRDPQGGLLWTTERDGAVVEMHREPDTPWWRRTQSAFIAMLPFEKYL